MTGKADCRPPTGKVSAVYHVEMRMGISVVRAFNLSSHDLQVRFLAPLMADQDFVYEGHEWSPRKTRISIFDGPELPLHQLSMGRGWPNVQRTSQEVTVEILEQARSGGIKAAPPAPADHALRERIIGRLSAGPIALSDVVRIAGDMMEGRRVSEQLSASEMAVWSLLHTGEAGLEADGLEVAQEMWEPLVLSPHSWLDGDRGVRLVRVAGAKHRL